jgi:uncharacterized protein YdaL
VVFCDSSYATDVESSQKSDVIILYDLENYYGDDRDAVEAIGNLVSHFDHRAERKNLFEDVIELSDYEYLIVYLENEENLRDDWIEILKKYKGKIVWIGQGVNKLEKGIVDVGRVNNLIRVVYNDKTYDIGVKRYFRKVQASLNSEVYSELFDGSNYYPFIVRDENLWYVSRLDLNEPLFYIFSDVLFDIFDEIPEAHEGVYFKIQDIHPFTDPKNLKRTMDIFLERGIPFAMSVIPIYKEEGANFETPIREKKDLIKIIKYGEANGGSLILQGSHQFFSSDGIRGQDYFEWKKDKGGTIEEWIDEIIEESMSEMAYNKFYPIAFDPKHFNLSDAAYVRVSKHFDTMIGWLQDKDWLNKYTIYPFEIKSSHGFKTYIPENLTYEYRKGPYALQELEERLDKVTITRQFLGGISITPDIDEKVLVGTIDYILSSEIPCLSLDEFDINVDSEFYNVEIINGQSVIEVGNIAQIDSENVVLLGVFYIILLALVFVVILFGITYFKSRKKTKNRLF